MKNESKIRFAAIIPARYASSRFPGKPLAMIAGKIMIIRVVERALESVSLVYVATDDERIFRAVREFGANVVMTSPHHQSGTDRCSEAVELISRSEGIKIDAVLNIQGDEPFIRPGQIDLLKSCFDEAGTEVATLVRKTLPGEDIFNPNHPKVVLDTRGNAIYFSRAVIPFHRDTDAANWSDKHTFYKHLGLYGYTTAALRKITSLPRSPLEIAESLEQNRWIENGIKIKTAVTGWESISIDTPEDIDRALEYHNKFNL
jgi:3-deoxy-manno-octulosonate cytidylyltransferase (CMP-KDO synthetase)